MSKRSGDRVVPFLVRYRDQRGWHGAYWEERTRAPHYGRGKPTNAKAEAWRVGMNASFQAGQINDHLGKAYGFVPHISHVLVVAQATGDVVAYATMPMFEVVE